MHLAFTLLCFNFLGNPDMSFNYQHTPHRASMPPGIRLSHGVRHPRSFNPRYFRPPPPGYVLRGPPRGGPHGLPPPWAQPGGVPPRPGMGQRQFRPIPPSSSSGAADHRSQLTSPVVSPRGPPHGYVPRRGGPPPPGFIASHRGGVPRHRMPRGCAPPYQHPAYHHPPRSHMNPSPSNGGNTSPYYSAPSSPMLRRDSGHPNICRGPENELGMPDADGARGFVGLGQSELGTSALPHHCNPSPLDDANCSLDKSSTITPLHKETKVECNIDCNDYNTSNENMHGARIKANRTLSNESRSTNADIESDSSFMPNEDTGLQDASPQELLPRAYSKAKPLYEAVRGENKFTSTLRRLSSVRKRNKTIKRNKADQQKTLGGEGRSTVVDPNSDLATGCDKFLNDGSINPNYSGSLLPNSFNSSVDPTMSSLSAACSSLDTSINPGGGVIRPSSTTSKDSETEGAVTSGYFR